MNARPCPACGQFSGHDFDCPDEELRQQIALVTRVRDLEAAIFQLYVVLPDHREVIEKTVRDCDTRTRSTSARQITVEPSEAEKAQRRLDPAAYAEQVIVNEAWYNCRVHGTVHHPLGPDTDTPCPQCAADDRGLARDE